MKKIFVALGTLSLGLAAGVPLIENINPTPEVKNNLTPYDYIIYKKLLANFRGILQEKSSYCVPASIQSILWFLYNQSPSQNELAHRVNATDSCGADGDKVVNTLNAFSQGFSFYNTIIPKNYGLTTNQMLLFQNAVTQTLLQDRPLMLVFNGKIPWDNEPTTKVHAVPITGIEVNSNSTLTRYRVAETETGQEVWFTSADLVLMFSIGQGALITPTHDVFDFKNERIMLWVDGAKGSTHTWATPARDTLTENADLLHDAGITSLDNLKAAKSLVFADSAIHYKWKDYNYNTFYFNVNPKDFSEDQGWIKDTQKSETWIDNKDGSRGEIDCWFNQTLAPLTMNLTLQFAITGNGDSEGGNNSPYVDFNMGSYWYINY